MICGVYLRGASISAALGVLGALAGCQSDNQAEAEFPVVLVAEGRSGGLDGMVLGKLVLVGDCAGLEFEGSDFVVVWPDGTKAVEVGDSFELVLPDDTRLSLGEDFATSGGYADPEERDDLPRIPDTCPYEGPIGVANSEME